MTAKRRRAAATDTGKAHGPGFPLPTAQEAGFDFPPHPRPPDSIEGLRELVRHGRETLIEWAEEDKPAERRFCLAVARGWITEWWNLARRIEGTPPPMPSVEGTQEAVDAADVLLRWCDPADGRTQQRAASEPVAVAAKPEPLQDGPWSNPDGPQQWARMFGFSVDTLKRRFKAGKIRHKKHTTKSYSIHVDDVPKAPATASSSQQK